MFMVKINIHTTVYHFTVENTIKYQWSISFTRFFREKQSNGGLSDMNSTETSNNLIIYNNGMKVQSN